MRSAQDNAAIRVPFDSDHLLQAIVPPFEISREAGDHCHKTNHINTYGRLYVKQVRVKSMQPRIVVVGGSANSLSIIFSAGPLLESDFLFSRDGSDSRRLPINETHLENAKSIYYEHEHAVRLQHTKQDEGKGILALAQKLQALSPSFDSLCTLVRVSNYNVGLCVSTLGQFVTNCFISQCNAAVDRFHAQMVEKIQQQNAEARGGLAYARGDLIPVRSFLSSR